MTIVVDWDVKPQNKQKLSATVWSAQIDKHVYVLIHALILKSAVQSHLKLSEQNWGLVFKY